MHGMAADSSAMLRRPSPVAVPDRQNTLADVFAECFHGIASKDLVFASAAQTSYWPSSFWSSSSSWRRQMHWPTGFPFAPCLLFNMFLFPLSFLLDNDVVLLYAIVKVGSMGAPGESSHEASRVSAFAMQRRDKWGLLPQA
ncbi:unnamed protein product [Cladocopium goreaui]|uniref:Uncharacterized protein n=1 Tax=Cladocopium goreaui TaxID=2562237 RepID=A0A9P1FIK6_9DINO|nr:unnamed protein product [Cladocopium goreaui]